MRLRLLAAALLAAMPPLAAHAQDGVAPRPDQQAFRGLYKELVETNTTLSVGDCTQAESRMAARLRAAGYTDSDVTMIPAPGKPKEGSLVAVLRGSDPSLKAVLLLAHVDVVEARREDWTRDPFTLVEENGYFWARGASDDKAEAAIWTDTMVRLKTEGFRPRRTIKMALTCGEETSGAFNGANDLSSNHRDLIDAAFALNEGAGGLMTHDGRKLMNGVMVREKTSQNYTVEATNPGGHSSRPTPDNAIYELADALKRVQAYSFPIRADDATRAEFAQLGALRHDAEGQAMAAFAKDPADLQAAAVIAADPSYGNILHTTCVATLLSAGHATNALPQRARANVNCRIWPGVRPEEVRADLERVIADPKMTVSIPETRGALAQPSPLSPMVMGPLRTVSEKHFPGVPVTPVMLAGATDGEFLGNVGIPTYGVSGIFQTDENSGIHGLNEHIPVRSLYEGRDFLFDLVKAYASA